MADSNSAGQLEFQFQRAFPPVFAPFASPLLLIASHKEHDYFQLVDRNRFKGNPNGSKKTMNDAISETKHTGTDSTLASRGPVERGPCDRFDLDRRNRATIINRVGFTFINSARTVINSAEYGEHGPSLFSEAFSVSGRL